EFDITDVNYQNPDEQETTAVFSNQDTEVSLVFEDVTESDRYLYFASYRSIPEDSIALIGALRFVLDQSTPFEQEVFHLEFVIEEAREHLTQQADGSYTYNSNEVLAERLSDENWGRDNSLFADAHLSQFLLSFPDATFPEYWVQHYTMSSNGFYFEHENLEFTSVQYQQATDEIILSGTFGVEMKELSCGFYSFFSVTNANFKVLIQ
ncbi:MAG: hypothetical protein AAFN81_26675, partial [Bacteroidota bacterium]